MDTFEPGTTPDINFKIEVLNQAKYSIIVPVFNRPQEVDELLGSLLQQTFKNFEIIIVEDGSTNRCDQIVDQFRDKLRIEYFFKPNSGPGPSRNAGFSIAKGNFFVVFDSDCIIPSTYFEAVEKSLEENNYDAWGGPDRAHEDFSIVQRAMGYTMSSVLTTGGIRGGKKRLGWFQPRSFNMGISRKVFEQTKGFAFDRFAEDIEFSIRMKNAGFHIGLIPDAYVYHKRRTNFSQFYKQVFNFGRGRVLVGRKHPQEIKLTHWFPSLFVMGVAAVPFMLIFNPLLFKIGALSILLYLILLLIHSLSVNKNLAVAFFSVPAAIVQLSGYGLGFLSEKLKSYTP
ncbi:MAG TPA: glycosyltransferase [Chryseolinea sp.]|nr:glycosyltransferase [Chryseolinea sp.]HPM30288.1 glycosyltransferase [Chryseolinea sp.]